jgi:hypothetical protein
MYKKSNFVSLTLELPQKTKWYDKKTKTMTETKPSPESYEFQTDKPKFKDSITGETYYSFGYQKWTQTKHYQDAVRQGMVETLASVDIENTNDPRFSKVTRKFIWFFKNKSQSKSIDGFKPISQTMPQYAQQQMTEAQPSAPDNAQPVTMEDHKSMRELDDEIPF